MSTPPPILDLQRLGLGPGASPEALKTAWRRAVSQLHPDRHGDDAASTLAEVNAAFQRLQEFHRRHGRLPTLADCSAPAALRQPPSRRRRWLVAAAGAAAAALVLWPQAEPPALPDVPQADAVPGAPAAGIDADAHAIEAPIGQRAERIAIGATPDEVERLAGPPVFRSGERWEYGPSEIRFTEGRVSGWYSSPLRPLPVADIDH